MRHRCYCENNKQYHRYGGRGIYISEVWQEYLPFRKWAYENGYNDTLTLDRIDNDKEYSPENCQWISREANTSKAQCCAYVRDDGKTFKTIQDIMMRTGYARGTIAAAISRKQKIRGHTYKTVHEDI